jgi:hypothetical protein
MNPAEAPKIAHIFKVRDRPVGLQIGKWGGALVAVERGHFPISPTGYRSLCSHAQGRVVTASMVSGDFLESLAANQDRERQTLMRQLREDFHPGRDRVTNYIHASLYADKGFHDGFFAPEKDRAILWPAAHRLLCLIDLDRRFQPEPNERWDLGQCARAVEKARAMKRLLERCAKGDLPPPQEVPIGSMTTKTYLELPPKPAGERQVMLHGITTELPLNLAPSEKPAAHSLVRETKTPATELPDHQLGLFEAMPPQPAKPSL